MNTNNTKTFLNNCVFSPVLYIETCFNIKLSSQQKLFADTFAKFLLDRYYRWMIREGQIKESEVPEQIKGFETVSKNGISISSGRGTGKSAIISLVLLWVIHLFRDAKILLIAPSESQLRDITISEIKLWTDKVNSEGKFVYPFRKLVNLNLEQMSFHGSNSVVTFKPIAANISPEMLKAVLSGRHSTINIFIIEEAISQTEAAIQTLTMSQTDPVSFTVLAFNPVAYSYAVQTVFDPNTSKMWSGMIFDYTTSELCNPDALARFKEEFVENSANYNASVRGIYNITSYEKCFPDPWVLSSIKNWEPIHSDIVIRSIGVDVAADGDDLSVVCVMENTHIKEFIELEGSDSKAKTYNLAEIITEHNINYCGIDVIGPGLSIYEELKKICPNIVINGLKNSRKALNEAKFVNSRAESVWLLRDWFEKQIISIENFGDSKGQIALSKLRQELSAFEYVKKNEKLAIVSKEKIRNKLGRSPDFTDAILCAIYRNNYIKPESMKQRLVSPKDRKRRILDMYEDEPNSKDWMTI